MEIFAETNNSSIQKILRMRNLASKSGEKDSSLIQKSVTFLIQGPWYEKEESGISTMRLIESVKTHFPESKIILSTWDGTKLPELDNVLIIKSRDPGFYPLGKGRKEVNNINRQILSTKNGLFQVTSKYAIKVRSDLEFFNTDILLRLNEAVQLPARELLDSHVINMNISSVNPRKEMTLVFHPCDWVYGGFTRDLIKIWNIPLMDEKTALYFDSNAISLLNRNDNYFPKIRPEMYIWINFLNSSGVDIPLESYYDCNHQLIALSEKYFAENLIFYEPKSLGVISQKHKFRILDRYQMYSYYDWIKMATTHGVIQSTDISFNRRIFLQFNFFLFAFHYRCAKTFLMFCRLISKIRYQLSKF